MTTLIAAQHADGMTWPDAAVLVALFLFLGFLALAGLQRRGTVNLLGWHPTLFQVALASSVIGCCLLAVVVGKALRLMDDIDRSRRWDDDLRALSAPAGELPPGFQIIAEPPYDWSVDA